MEEPPKRQEQRAEEIPKIPLDAVLDAPSEASTAANATQTGPKKRYRRPYDSGDIVSSWD